MPEIEWESHTQIKGDQIAFEILASLKKGILVGGSESKDVVR